MKQNFVVTEIERVALVGKGEYPEQHISFSNNIWCNELTFRCSGQSTIFFDDMVLKTRENTIQFLPKGIVSEYEMYHEPGDYIIIDFHTDKPVSDKAFVIDYPQNESIGWLFQKIFACWANKESGYYFHCFSLLYRILAEIQQEQAVYMSHSRVIQPAVDAILNGYLDRELNVAGLAEMCGISEAYLHRLFMEKYNTSPKKYMIMMKINHACRLLQTNKYNINQVAEMCNYSDVYFFSKQFKEYLGMTPSQFIKKYKSSK